MHTVKRDVVEVELGSFNFFRILLGDVAKGEQLLLSKYRVVIETELGVQAEDWNQKLKFYISHNGHRYYYIHV